MKLHNPTIAGFHPDPSVVRVGADYYLACSSFEYLPGIPLFHSRDLRSWTLIGHVADRPGQLAVEEVPTGGGAWAPTIRHHDGRFWVAVTDALGRGTLLFTASDPAGPWSDGTVVDGVDGIDPDLAWDEDGTCFMTYSALRLGGESMGQHGGIEQVRIDPYAARAVEEPRSLWSGTGLMFPEAPHLYRHDGWWYLLIAEGGTERGHAVSVARGRRPDGPFEGAPGNPILSARSTSRPIQNTGHGDLVSTPDGEWAMVLLGMRTRGLTRAFSPMGRETFATGVTWQDGWPAAEPVHLTEPAAPLTSYRESFDGAGLDGEWVGVRRLPADLADLKTRPGHLVLRGEGTGMDDPRPVFVGIRQRHHHTRLRADIDASAGTGGLAVRYDEAHHYSVEVAGGAVVARGRVAGLEQTWTAPVATPHVTLWIETVPVAEVGFGALSCDTIRLGYDTQDGPAVLAEIDGRYLTAETAASFTGRVMGIFARDGDLAIDTVVYTGSDAPGS